MICLTHIPKTGGTTFRGILINNFSWRHVDFPVVPKKVIKSDDFPLDSSQYLKRIQSLSGHSLQYSDGMRENFPYFKFVTFLREPIDRLVSLYYHIQRFEDPDLKFNEWVVENYDTPLLSNSQALFIAGEPDLERAKRILDKEYFFAGSMDNFDKNLLILQRMIGQGFDVRYVRKNTAPRKKKIKVDPTTNKEAFDLLYEHNQVDIQLCEYVNKIVIPRYEEMFGVISEHDIEKFRKENELFQPNFVKRNIFRIVKYLFYENLFRLKSK